MLHETFTIELPYEELGIKQQGSATMNDLRDNAAEWDVEPDKLIIAGFSAGGHVAGLLGTGWNSKRLDYLLENVLHCSHEYVKPDGMLFGNPVITSGIVAHRASFERSRG